MNAPSGPQEPSEVPAPTERDPKPPVFPAWWIAIGVAIGVALGASSAIDLGIGIAMGVALGAAVASSMYAADKRRYEAQTASGEGRDEAEGPDAGGQPTA